MKNYIVKALKNFKDKQENVDRKTGDKFETTKERYEFLKEHNAVKLEKIIEEIVDEIIESEEVNEIIDNEVDRVLDEIITKKKRKSSKK